MKKENVNRTPKKYYIQNAPNLLQNFWLHLEDTNNYITSDF